MKTYTFKVNRRTTSHGSVQFEVQAESKAQAKRLFIQGFKHEVNNHVDSTWNDDTKPEIISERADPESLLDHIN